MTRRIWGFIAVGVIGTYASVVVAQRSGTVLTGSAAFGDWTADRPGLVRHITPRDLPAPNPAESARNNSQVAPRPENAALQVPAGFTVAEYFGDVQAPRTLRVAPNGDVFVVESNAGRVRVLRPGSDPTKPAAAEIFAEGLTRPYGVNFYPADNPQWVYVAEVNAVVRFPYRPGDMKARGAAEQIIPKIVETVAGHWTRDIAFTRDGRRMLVAVGSQSNFAEGLMPPKTPQELAAWEKENGVGASWGAETHRAAVLSFTPEGGDRKVFANGIRK